MRSSMKTGLCLVLAVLLILPLSGTARAAEETDAYVQQLVQYYLYYQEDAQTEVSMLLDYIGQLDPDQGQLWREIMDSWSYCLWEMPVHAGQLPEELPEDDSLCIVVMGYGLNPNGAMRDELVARLETALRCARRYPNAWVAVTGGPTAAQSDATEAGQMARWLLSRGLEESRLILETESLSTPQNARNVHRLLTECYPSVSSIALVTSDYHVRRSCVLFETAANCARYRGKKALELVGNAYNTTGKEAESLWRQASGICELTGVPFVDNGPPER